MTANNRFCCDDRSTTFSVMVVYTGMSVSDISLPKSRPQSPPIGTVNPSGHYSVNTE